MPSIKKKHKVTKLYLFYRVAFVTVLLLVLPILIWAVKNPSQIVNQFANLQTQNIEATKTSYEIPVMVITFLPDENSDGYIDSGVDMEGNDVSFIRQRLKNLNKKAVEYMTKATIYKGYKNPTGTPALRFVLSTKHDYEEVNNPPKGKLAWGGPDREPDYMSILTKYNICNAVDNEGIKEVWMWTQHGNGIYPNESNFSSKLAGDVSNSERYQDDLPLCNKSYTLYNYNFSRGVAEMVHNRGHQMEHLFNEWPKRDTTPESQWKNLLFWGRFVGSEKDHEVYRPGCGWIHEAPNVPVDQERTYIYFSGETRQSDCEDWKPNGTGLKKEVSCMTYFKYLYGKDECFDDQGLSFFVWWMQNIPGYGNDLYDTNGKKLRNWWDYMGDFDNVYKSGSFLYLSDNAPAPNDTLAPSVNIVTPAIGSTISGTVTVETSATDNVGLANHKILFDNTGNPIYTVKDCGTATSCTYTFDVNSLNLKADERPEHFVIVVEARDAKNNLGRKYIEVKAQKTTTPPGSVGPSKILNPTNDSNIAFPVTFEWEKSTDASEYHLYLSSTVGQKDYFTKRYTDSVTSALISSSDMLKSIANNSTVYVRLWTNTGTVTASNWKYNDYTYKFVGVAPPPQITGPSKILSPANNSNIVLPVTFIWEKSSNASEYHLYLSSVVGQKDYFTRRFTNLVTSITLSSSDALKSIPSNSTVYVRLWTNNGTVQAGSWKYNDYTYKFVGAASPPVDTTPPNVTITSPANGSTVSGNITINVNASDNVGVTSIDILVDGTKIKNCGGVTSCSTVWNTTSVINAIHTITAQAYDAKSNKGSAAIGVDVNNPVISNTSTMISPANDSLITFPVTFKWAVANPTPKYYAIYLGTAPNQYDLYSNSFRSNVTSLTLNKINLKKTVTSGSKIYVKLWTNLQNGSWMSSSYIYTVK